MEGDGEDKSTGGQRNVGWSETQSSEKSSLKEADDYGDYTSLEDRNVPTLTRSQSVLDLMASARVVGIVFLVSVVSGGSASALRSGKNIEIHLDKRRKPMAMSSAFLLTLVLATFQMSAAFSETVSVDPLRFTNLGDLHRSDFPKDFVFGTATSAYQVEGAVTEGGRGESIWDTWVKTPGNILDESNADVSVDQYHRFEDDVELVSELNMDAYRFSISWTRIFPNGYGPETNKEGIAYYNRLIDSLLNKGIKPYVTLFHWDLPQSLQDSFGGWMDRQIVYHFLDFAEACFTAFGDRVKNWITLNEPGVFTASGYSVGDFPPGRNSDADTEVYIVAHNFLLAHAAAVDMYRKKFQTQQKGVIGMTVECQFAIPLTNLSEDRDAAQRYLEFELGWFLDPVFFGDYPAVMRQNVGARLPIFSAEEVAILKGSLDFVGINHYSSRWATTGPGPLPNASSSMALDRRVILTSERDNTKIGPTAASPWLYIVPWGLYGTLKWTSERYKAPIIVTENGMDYEGSLSLQENVRDGQRVQFYQEYLSAALGAIREGADVRAYFAWTLMDNFEWVSGFSKRFGLIYVDYNDGLKRYPKDSAFWFKQFLDRSQADS